MSIKSKTKIPYCQNIYAEILYLYKHLTEIYQHAHNELLINYSMWPKVLPRKKKSQYNQPKPFLLNLNRIVNF